MRRVLIFLPLKPTISSIVLPNIPVIVSPIQSKIGFDLSFRTAVLPSDNEVLRELAETRRSVSPYIRLPSRVERELADLFRA